jgi:hypothetical protein
MPDNSLPNALNNYAGYAPGKFRAPPPQKKRVTPISPSDSVSWANTSDANPTFKGTLARDFRLLVFFIKSIHLVP